LQTDYALRRAPLNKIKPCSGRVVSVPPKQNRLRWGTPKIVDWATRPRWE